MAHLRLTWRPRPFGTQIASPSSEPLKLCLSQGGDGRPALVIHSWWGLTSAFVDFGETLAEEGFAVGLADLFDGKTASNPEQAKRLRGASRREPMYRTLIRNIGELQAFDGRSGAKVGLVGFSMGGHWAVWLSQRPELPIGATVLYYAARGGSFAGSVPRLWRTTPTRTLGSAGDRGAEWKPRLRRRTAATRHSTIRVRIIGSLKAIGSKIMHQSHRNWHSSVPSCISGKPFGRNDAGAAAGARPARHRVILHTSTPHDWSKLMPGTTWFDAPRHLL